MTILIDPPAWPAHGTLWSHLVSDADYDELHVFARRLGVPRRGFDLDHYDVPASMYEQAVALGALPVSAKEVVHRLRDTGLRVRQVEREATTPVRRGEYLRAEWLRLGGLFGDAFGIEADRRPGDEWVDTGRELLTRWNEPHRVYHDERHLEDVLLSLDQLATRGERIAPETLLAAWFHDAVYAGAVGADAGSDELASARLAVDSLTRCGLDPELARAVGEFVVATTPGGELGSRPSARPPARRRPRDLCRRAVALRGVHEGRARGVRARARCGIRKGSRRDPRRVPRAVHDLPHGHSPRSVGDPRPRQPHPRGRCSAGGLE